MNDYRLNWQQPLPRLGALVKPEKPAQKCEFREFETKDYGAAQQAANADTGARASSEQAMSPVAAPPSTGKWVEHCGTEGPGPDVFPQGFDQMLEIRRADGVTVERFGSTRSGDWGVCRSGYRDLGRRPILAYRVLP